MEELLERKKGLHRTILIVDDEIIEREMLGAMLQDSYTVIYAENGAVALDIIKQDKLTLSLIILIVNELYGRHRGDMILKKIGGCIHELVCRTGGLACRFNSNCFGIYLPHVPEQVLINILSNAVKFTNPPGKITLTVERTAVFEDQSTLRFVIRDTGIGMNPEFIPRIFDTFTQEDSSRNSKYGSTGLGMAIAKSIVELMNGTISVSSEKGVGTEFTVVVTLQNSRHSYEDGIGAGPVFRRADGYSDAGDGRLYGGENDPCAAG